MSNPGRSGVRPLFAEAGEIRIDQTRIPLRNIVIFELQFLARRMRRVDDQHVGPFDQPLENLLGARRFQIERHAALVAIGQVPGIGVFRLRLRRDLVTMSPEVAVGRLNLDDVSAKVGQDHGGALDPR